MPAAANPPTGDLPAPNRDALVTTALDGSVITWNRGAEALFGWRERDVVGRPFAVLIHEKHRTVDAQSCAEVAAGHTVRAAVLKQVRSDGATLSCLQTLLPVRDATGRVTAIRRIIFDLSPLQEAERALRRALAQVRDLATAAATGPAGAGTLRDERERTRTEYLRIVAGEARRLDGLVDELAVATGDEAVGTRSAAVS